MTVEARDTAVDTDRRDRRPRHRQSWADAVTEYWSQIDAADVLIGVAIAVGGGYFLVGNVSVSLAMALAIVVVGFCRHPQQSVRGGGLFLLAGAVLYLYLVLVSIKQGTPWSQRVARFSLLLGMSAAIAQRRVDWRSLILGMCMGSAVNVPAFYLGLTSNAYPPYLTGWYGDKNVAGMYYSILALLGLLVFARRWRVGWLVGCTVFVYLSGSRTSMSALALGLMWLLVRNRVSPVVRLVLCGVAVWGLVTIETSYARVGVFADRAGTDWYRHQIDLATEAKAAITPWHGLGLNEGYVYLGDVRRAWMHDAYYQAFVEGGYPFLAATVVAFAVLALGLFDQARTVTTELLVIEASVVAVLVCAWKIGEGFMTVIAFIVLGMAIGARYGKPLTSSAQHWRGT